MKILILNENLRSGMQMYLALSNHYQVEIANDADDLLRLVAQENPDYTFLDLNPDEPLLSQAEPVEIANKIIKEHPSTKIVGIYDDQDNAVRKKAEKSGILKFIARPIKNRELLKLIES
jgi:DNA-binding NtrC family response regulator